MKNWVFTNKSWDSTKSDRIVHQSTFVGYEARNLIGILPFPTDVTLKLGAMWDCHCHEIWIWESLGVSLSCIRKKYRHINRFKGPGTINFAPSPIPSNLTEGIQIHLISASCFWAGPKSKPRNAGCMAARFTRLFHQILGWWENFQLQTVFGFLVKIRSEIFPAKSIHWWSPIQLLEVAGSCWKSRPFALQEAAARKQKEQLLREAHCWKECEAGVATIENPWKKCSGVVRAGLRRSGCWYIFIEVCLLIHKYWFKFWLKYCFTIIYYNSWEKEVRQLVDAETNCLLGEKLKTSAARPSIH